MPAFLFLRRLGYNARLSEERCDGHPQGIPPGSVRAYTATALTYFFSVTWKGGRDERRNHI
jgi:hypothetical protein